MSNAIQRLTAMKERITRLGVQKTRAEGALEKYKDELKAEFGCATVKKAKTKLTALTGERDELKTQINEQLEAMETRYA